MLPVLSPLQAISIKNYKTYQVVWGDVLVLVVVDDVVLVLSDDVHCAEYI